MAKISELPASGPLTGNETMPIVQGGAMKQAPFAGVIDAITVSGDAQVARVEAEGTAQLDLMTAQRVLTETAAASGQASLLATQTAALALTGNPAVAPAPLSRTFGQASADALTTAGYYDFPAGATAPPAVGTDWMMCGWLAPGFGFSTAQAEVYLSNGNFAADGGSARTISLLEGGAGIASGKLTVNALLKNVGQQLMPNRTPALTTAAPFVFGVPIFLVLTQVGNKTYFAWDHVENGRAPALRSFTADTNHGLTEFYGAASVNVAATSAVRAANVVTLTRVNHGMTVGRPLWLVATGELTFVATVPNANTFTVASVGADGALANLNYRPQAATPVGDLFVRMGAASLATSGDVFGFGGRLGGFHFLRGTANTPGSLAALISGGAINPTVFRNLADGLIAPTSIANAVDVYSFRDPEGAVTGERSGLGGLTKTGTSYQAEPVAQPSWLRPDPRPRFPHAIDPGKYTGAIRFRVGTSISMRMLKATLYSDAALTTVVKTVPVAGTFNPADGGMAEVVIPDVLDDLGYYVKVENVDNPNVFCVSGPHDVGPVIAKVSQSTLNTWGSTVDVGSTVTPDSTNGLGFTLAESGIDPLNTNGFARVTFKTLRTAGQHGDGDVAAINKIIALRSADPARAGRKVAVGLVSLCVSGHPKEAFIYDRKRVRASIGNLVANTLLNFSWKPATFYANTAPVYIKAGTARLFVGNRLVATSDASGNWVGQGVTGAIGQSNGNGTVTAAFAGAAEIEAELEFRTGTAATTERAANGFSVWGDEASTASTGRMLNVIRALGTVSRATYTLDAWLNFMGTYGPGLGADLATYMADVNDKLYARIAAVTVFPGKSYARAPFAGAQRIYMADPRTQSFTDANQQTVRNAQRAYAIARGFPYVPGPVTYEVDIVGSPHAGPGAQGAILGGEVMAHGIEWVAGTAGAIGEEVVPVGVTRINATTVEITLSGTVESFAAIATTGAGGAVQGLFFGTTEANMARLDPATWVPVLSGRKITVTNAGGIPSGWWNGNVGSVVSSAVTPLSAQTTLLNNTLTLNQGGFTSAVRKGNGLQANSVNLYCA